MAASAPGAEEARTRRERLAFMLGRDVRAASKTLDVPEWPPDLFAVVATWVRDHESYAKMSSFDESHLAVALKEGEHWRVKGTMSKATRELWRDFVESSEPNTAALRLLAVADEAARGIGFLPELPATNRSVFQEALIEQHRRMIERSPDLLFPHVPHSLCREVVPELACVQPKSRTPQVGCTLRSLSHHLALLPSVGEVKTHWQVVLPSARKPQKNNHCLNLLLVPFPYRIDGSCFQTGHKLPGQPSAFFHVHKGWLVARSSGDSTAATPGALSTFLVELAEQTRREVQELHGLVLPEGALDTPCADTVTAALARSRAVGFFVAGVADAKVKRDGSLAAPATNSAYSVVMGEGELVTSWTQPKHHRWKLERSQIARYHLGNTFDPGLSWWEHIDVNHRQCFVYVVQHGLSIATLICEDLARVDPVQTAVRAIGPNLVIALLMDGPQWERRWPGKYATVLAEDPGSSVLTLSSLGMVRRSYEPGEQPVGFVGLWKGGGEAKQLILPGKAHALLVSLAIEAEETLTLDGRRDGLRTNKLTLVGVREIRHPNPPKFASYD